MSRSTQHRKQKNKTREQRQIRQARKKRELFDGALRNAGLKEAYLNVDDVLRPVLQSWVFNKPVVVPGPTMEDCPEGETLSRVFLSMLRSPSSCPELSITPNEWLSILNSLQLTLNQIVDQYESTNSPFKNKAFWPGIRDFTCELRQFKSDNENKLITTMLADLFNEVIVRSRLDEKIFWFEFGYLRASKKKVMKPQFTLHRDEPTWAMIDVDGKPRRAFRCKIFDVPPKPRELAWPRSELGVVFGPDHFPVYMQSHVLEQIERRVPLMPVTSVMFSIGLPKFFNVDKGRFLVESRIAKQRVGYFVGEVVGDKVLLKTFLFLTMQGTPESDLLYKNLRLTRSDINYTHLDELAFFADPELAGDKQLRGILDECGCGHLFDLDPRLHPEQLPAGNAEVFRNYLQGAQPPSRRMEI